MGRRFFRCGAGSTACLAYMPVFYPYAYYIFDSDLNVGPLYTTHSGFLYKDFSWK